MSKQITEKAKQGQKFLGLPADLTAPVAGVTVNGTAATFTTTPNGVVLDAPANQDDVVVITFTTQY
ncbi:hypothetical protein KDX16_19820 [Burkholderia vietnamiensis]|uniref:hypothetical protein n=1 Tax=Burkholderia vietnamiensis TaxID=60552 RepID=UPI00158F10A4|nr:hypothetical protein [Burkholderia vietnamiensis]MBR7918036.1 hypothetical protein [Burkholderia vietnamiensis]